MTTTLKRLCSLAISIACFFMLGSCANGPIATAPIPKRANVCETQASLVNPNALSRDGGHGGIGGTGKQAANMLPKFELPGEGGIGGTGIVGIVTGFASVCVNGVEVHYDEATPVSENGLPSTAGQLAIGQVVAIAARGTGEQTRALSIAMIHVLVGAVQELDHESGRLVVLGQSIRMLQDAKLPPLKTGDWVQVSGYRIMNGDVMASRVTHTPFPATIPDSQQQNVQVRGSINRIDGTQLTIGSTRIELGSLANSNKLMIGHEIWVNGIWRDDILYAQNIVQNPTTLGLGTVSHVVFEGLIQSLHNQDKHQEINLGFQNLEISKNMQFVGGSLTDLKLNQRVQISGHVGQNQRISIDRIHLISQGATALQNSKVQGRSGMNRENIESNDRQSQTPSVSSDRQTEASPMTSNPQMRSGRGSEGGGGGGRR